MNDREMIARQNHRNGNNCSCYLALTFADQLGVSTEEAKRLVPPPRSIDGKCGAYLSIMAMLDKLDVDKKKEFEEKFLAKNGSLKCKEIIAKRVTDSYRHSIRAI